MAIQTTLADYRTRFYSRFDEGQSNYIDTATANSLINEARAHLHNWVVTSNEDYIVNEFSWAFVTGQRDYPLPLDFFKDLKVFLTYSDGTNPTSYQALPRFMRGEQRGGSAETWGFMPVPYAMRYRILGQVLRLDPAPQTTTGYGVTMEYAPHYTALVNDTDVEQVWTVPGWDEFVVNQAVISAKLKEEASVADLSMRQAEIKQLIEQSMMNRDMGQPQHVIDVGTHNYGTGWRW